MIDLLKANAEWVFSGIGVAILVGIVAYFRNRSASKQLRSVPNSQIVDTHNSTIVQNSGIMQNVIFEAEQGNLPEANNGILGPSPALRITQFAIDPSSRYKMDRYDPQKEIYPGRNQFPAVLSTPEAGKIHYLGRNFESLDELEMFAAELKSRTNHYYFGWLDREGFTPIDVPIVFEKMDKNEPVTGQELHSVFTVTVSNDAALQIVLTRLELIIDRVISIRSAGETKTLASLATYDIKIQSMEGKFISEMIPPIKIAGGDSVRFSVRILPQIEQKWPTGKVLIASINVWSSDYCASTPRFMMYFED